MHIPVLVEPVTEGAIARFDELKAMKLNIGGTDLRIAAISRHPEISS